MADITPLKASSLKDPGTQAICAAAHRQIDEDIRCYAKTAENVGGSKARKLLATAVKMAARHSENSHRHVDIFYEELKIEREWLDAAVAMIANGCLPMPYTFGPFDFVVHAKNGAGEVHVLAIDIVSPGRPPVETWVTDRMIQSTGHSIFHFAESEILADPWGSALQILDWAACVYGGI